MAASRWSMAVLPDTQCYVRERPEILEAQARWIADRADAHDIRFALHEGDIVDHNDDAEWRVARDALSALDGRVPYVLAAGNHDYGPGGKATDRSTGLDTFFPRRLFAERPSFRGTFEPDRIDNSVHVFETPSGPWLVLSLEFGPREAVVAWADRVLRRHAPTPVILLTHAYLYSDGTRYDRARRPDQKWSPHVYGVAKQPGGVNDGEALWQSLVRRHPQVRLVLCGHVLNEGVARLESRHTDGSRVHQLLANYQHRERGGNGFLRIVEMDDGASAMHVRTYSPYVDDVKDDGENQFTLTW